MCFATSVCSYVRSSMRVLKLRLQIALEWLHECCMGMHGLCFGEEAGARNLAFFRVKWLQPAMKGTSCVRRLRLRSLWFLLCVLQRVVVPMCVVAGDERYLVCAAVAAAVAVVPFMCFATSGCSCVRSSMRFLNLWLQIPLEWLHDCRSDVATCVNTCRFAT